MSKGVRSRKSGGGHFARHKKQLLAKRIMQYADTVDLRIGMTEAGVSDYVLAGRIKHEMKRRRVEFSRGDDMPLLLSESDDSTEETVASEKDIMLRQQEQTRRVRELAEAGNLPDVLKEYYKRHCRGEEDGARKETL